MRPYKGFDKIQLAARLGNLKKGAGYNPDLDASRFDQKLLTNKLDKLEANTELSSGYLYSLSFDQRFKRDLRLDYENPRMELPKYTKTVDQIPPFDKPPGTMIEAKDGMARTQVDLVLRSRENFVKQDTFYDRTLEHDVKYSHGLEAYENTIGPHEPPTIQDTRELARQRQQERFMNEALGESVL